MGASFLIIPGVRSGLYGGTALMVGFIFVCQVAVLLFAVGVPVLVMAIRRRLKLSREAVWLLALAVAGVAAEALVLWLVPVTGGS
ncbi:hypothetical protein [Luteolibacter soli]